MEEEFKEKLLSIISLQKLFSYGGVRHIEDNGSSLSIYYKVSSNLEETKIKCNYKFNGVRSDTEYLIRAEVGEPGFFCPNPVPFITVKNQDNNFSLLVDAINLDIEQQKIQSI